MLTSTQIRQQFLDFFADKAHKIVPSAPIVNKDDPTLLFTNSGMNQFKDYFLGNRTPDNPRIADTQKCLRVSGKHNDLEEVGRDSYHHTMFEMLGNWSFGDYFKEEAISWAWELLTEVYQLDKDRLYVSVFEGDEADDLSADEEAKAIWMRFLPEDRILYYDRKDNFWEMGETGPCGPCSEIHIDLRPDAERAKQDGRSLVNADHPQVVEIWNLVFIQYDRKADGSLEPLPAKHIDTGMGFERLCMALQGTTSNYDTDVFTPFIKHIEAKSGKAYTFSYADDAYVDIAMRVVVDHTRAVAFAISDGQLPDSNGAGYVIRRILRRAVRYYYTYLGIQEPFMHTLVPLLADYFGAVFPGLTAQQEQIVRVIRSEETAFLNTLERGIRRFEELDVTSGQISGADAFELYDTFGFPIDLTRLMAEEKGYTIDEPAFEEALSAQRNRARKDSKRSVGDWTELREGESAFVGYDHLSVSEARIIKYRTVKNKKGEQYQLVLDRTPFYAESGGQRGDKGLLFVGEEKIPVLDTVKENELTVHLVKKFPQDFEAPVRAEVHTGRRAATSANHSAAHLMHAALHQILGEHAVQKGQDVDDQRMRFDFNHFERLTDEEVAKVEQLVNEKIRENIMLQEDRALTIAEAKAAGAMMLFGEKYGDLVRMITFDKDFSRELCGGTHVAATGEIGSFKILSETGVAAGVRRIEAVTAAGAQAYVNKELETLHAVKELLKNPRDLAKSVRSLQEDNKALKKQIEQLQAQRAAGLKDELKNRVQNSNGRRVLIQRLDLDDSNSIKTLAHQLDQELAPLVQVYGAVVKDKPQLLVMVSKDLAGDDLHAGKLVRELAQHIKGGGGGQPFVATAGGKDVSGLDRALEAAAERLG